ncbi:MAG: FAD-linked oxidase C-terminal domain-containing protein [Planctomycetota bacterium]
MNVTELSIDHQATLNAHARRLSELIDGEVRFSPEDRAIYATDASIYQVMPLGVVVPRDARELAKVVAYCHEHDLAMLPRGGGTSLAGQGVNEAVVIDCSAGLRDIASVDEEERRCVVGSGVTPAELNREISKTGLFFAPDPSTVKQACLGGCIGNNAAGTRSVRYGRTSENVEALDVVLADGTAVWLGAGAAREDERVRALTEDVIDVVERHRELIRERFPKTLRRNAGYGLDMILDQIEGARWEGVDPLDRINLSALIHGSEGTLCFVTGGHVKLHRKPVATGLAVIGFGDLDEAIGLVPELLKVKPAAVELLDDLIVETGLLNAECRPFVERLPQPKSGMLKACLYVEIFASTDAGQVEEAFAKVREIVQHRAPNAEVQCLTDRLAIDEALALRRAGEPLLHAIPGKRKPLGFVEDNAVPVEHLGEFVRRFRELIESCDTRASFYAHASVGVLHVRPLLDLRDTEDEKRMHKIAVGAAALAKELGGVMSGEHGDGRARGPLLEDYFGPELMDAFREIKAIFDPKGLLNPGNIVSPGEIESMSTNTRIRPDRKAVNAVDVETYFDYEEVGGFGHAVEACNGAGVCRKRNEGTMCPSYMVTRDERHATRGRANHLRMAMTGQLGEKDVWNDPGVLETLDLCLSCKACQSECPSNVDVAAYKAEYLAQGYKQKGRVPLRTKFFGRVRQLNEMGSRFAPLSNVVAKLWPVRALNNALLGLAKERSLPRFERSLFVQARGMKLNSGLPEGSPVVVLYGDCFTSYNEPDIGLAAARLLNAFGYTVELADAGCCGRALISSGMLEEARGVVEASISKLSAKVAEVGACAVVVCEPSCLSSIRDEWTSLHHMMRQEASSLAGLTHMVEDFLEERWAEHPKKPEFKVDGERIVLHQHCHQKAVLGGVSTVGLLRRVVGEEGIEVLDAGCCGMAGSFGYTSSRYDLSMEIARQRLVPELAARSGCSPLATGTSCRHQIHDAAELEAIHPVVWLVERITE